MGTLAWVLRKGSSANISMLSTSEALPLPAAPHSSRHHWSSPHRWPSLGPLHHRLTCHGPPIALTNSASSPTQPLRCSQPYAAAGRTSACAMYVLQSTPTPLTAWGGLAALLGGPSPRKSIVATSPSPPTIPRSGHVTHRWLDLPDRPHQFLISPHLSGTTPHHHRANCWIAVLPTHLRRTFSGSALHRRSPSLRDKASSLGKIFLPSKLGYSSALIIDAIKGLDHPHLGGPRPLA